MVPQWQESGDPDFALDPCWSMYETLDRMNALLFMVVFEDDRPIGYAGATLHPHTNSQKIMVGTIPTWFVEKGSHRAFRVRSLLLNVINLLTQNGAKQVSIETSDDEGSMRLLLAMGFSVNKIGYTIKPVAKKEAACA